MALSNLIAVVLWQVFERAQRRQAFFDRHGRRHVIFKLGLTLGWDQNDVIDLMPECKCKSGF